MRTGNIRAVVEDGTEVTLRREEVLADACLECRSPTPAIHDVCSAAAGRAGRTGAARRRAAEFESRPLDARWARFQEIDLEVHPLQRLPAGVPDVLLQELPAGPDTAAVGRRRHGHLRRRDLPPGAGVPHGRPVHGVRGLRAGVPHGNRRAPAGAQADLEVEDLYGYRPGEAIDATPVLSAFAMDDPQEFPDGAVT